MYKVYQVYIRDTLLENSILKIKIKISIDVCSLNYKQVKCALDEAKWK